MTVIEQASAKRKWPWIVAGASVGLVLALAFGSWLLNRPDVEFVSGDGAVTYDGSVAGECWDVYRWRLVVWDRIGSGDLPEAASGNWAPPRGLLDSRNCDALAVGPNLDGGPPMQARLPAEAGAGVYRICQWGDCVEFEYRP